MSPLLMMASTAITLALVFYTLGVFLERHHGTLTTSHVVLFWLGLICDTTGTTLMGQIARSGTASVSSIHALTGAIALILMAFHAIWAVVTRVRNNPDQLRTFHKFSQIVWLIWLIPYLTGFLMGIPAIALDALVALFVSVLIVVVLGVVLFVSTR